MDDVVLNIETIDRLGGDAYKANYNSLNEHKIEILLIFNKTQKKGRN